MGHPVKRIELKSLLRAKAVYSPKAQVLLIENGQLSAVGEEMAQGVLGLYDKDVDTGPTSAVAIRIDDAVTALKSFIDAILAKYAGNPETA